MKMLACCEDEDVRYVAAAGGIDEETHVARGAVSSQGVFAGLRFFSSGEGPNWSV